MNLIIESIGRPIEADFSKTSVAHARNAVILASIIDADIITCERDYAVTEGKQYKNIVCSYASPYMKYKKLIQVVRDNPDAKLWWFVNDHDLEDNILLRNVLKETAGKRKINMVCNNSREGYRGWILRKKIKAENGDLMGTLNDFIVEWHTLNLNALIFSYDIPYVWEQKQHEAIYYGTMRKWRINDIIKYQGKHLTLSATTRTQKKFIERGVTECPFVDKLSWQRGHEDLANYKVSLYVEDIHTHDNFAYMANRFYEGLMCNTITLFDVACRETLDKSAFNVGHEYVVDSKQHLIEKINHFSTRFNFERALADNELHKNVARKEHDYVVSRLKTLFN